MDEMKMYEKILEISKESSERDARMETQMKEFDKRLNKLEEQQCETQKVLEDVKDVLSEFKNKLNNDYKTMQDIDKKLDAQISSSSIQHKSCEERFTALEDGPKNLVWKYFKQIIGMLIVALASAGITYLLIKMGIKQ